MNLCDTLAFSVESSQESLSSLIGDITESRAAAKPAMGKWSVLECLEHIFLVEKGIFRLLSKPGEQSTDNPIDVKEKFGADKIRQIMSNRNHKHQSPETFAPKGIFSSLEEAKMALAGLRAQLANALREGSICLVSPVIPHPRMGEFSRTDWVNFLVEHAGRHYHQIGELKMQHAPEM